MQEVNVSQSKLLIVSRREVSAPGSMRLLNCEIYQRGRVPMVDDTELLLLIAHLIRPPGSIPGVG